MNLRANEMLVDYSHRGLAVWSDKLYWSICSDNLEVFKSVVSREIKIKYIQEIMERSRPSFLVHLNDIGFRWEELHAAYAIRAANLVAFKLLTSFNVVLTPYILLVAARYGTMDTFIYLHEHHKDIFPALTSANVSRPIVTMVAMRKRENILKFLLNENIYVNEAMIDEICKKDEGDMKSILCIFHDHRVKYDWGCKKGECVHCNERKDALIDDWILESYDYTSQLQWLPREIMEDVLDLL